MHRAVELQAYFGRPAADLTDLEILAYHAASTRPKPPADLNLSARSSAELAELLRRTDLARE